jgi:hypothetical protein
MGQVHDMVLGDWWMKVHEIAKTIGISKERVRVGYILHEELDMKKLCAKWVPRRLTADQKRTRMKISKQCLQRFNNIHPIPQIWLPLTSISSQNSNSSSLVNVFL